MRWIPNALTMGNVFFGCMAITLVPGMDLQGITLWMTASLICDALDGWASRKLGVEGEMGLQLDSLADAITFGLLPSLMAYQILLDLSFAVPSLAFIVVIASVYRRARFNVGEAGKKGFIGLPTPAHALFILGLAHAQLDGLIQLSAYALLALIALSSYSLNASWPVMSFKDMPSGFAAQKYRWLFLVSSLILLVTFELAALTFIIPLLLLFSAIEKRFA